MSEVKIYIPKRGDYERFRSAVKNSEGITKERAILQEFMEDSKNTDPEIVEKRVRKINSRYSTRLSNDEIVEMVRFISTSEFDKKIKSEKDYDLIEELAKAASARGRHNLSFATKYCHHCQPNKYPIFDELNRWVMTVYFGYKYNAKDSDAYKNFVGCYGMFCKEFIEDYDKLKGQCADEGFYIDKYIQAIGGGNGLRELLFQ